MCDWTVLRRLVRGKGRSKWSFAMTVFARRQPESDGSTTSALLWLNLRNVCTFSAVTLNCFLVSVYLFTSLYPLVFVLFLLI